MCLCCIAHEAMQSLELPAKPAAILIQAETPRVLRNKQN